MAKSLSSLFDKVLVLINKYSEDGVRIPESEVIDMKMKIIPLFDTAHKDVFDSAKMVSTQTIPTDFIDIANVTEVNYLADEAIVYYGAARIAPFKKKELVTFFEDEWLRLRSRCANKASEVAIIDVYNLNGEEEI